VFDCIGEFTIHKEFVSSKVAGDTASLSDPALDRIHDFAAEGLSWILPTTTSTSRSPRRRGAGFLTQMRRCCTASQRDDRLGARGLGRVIHPVQASLRRSRRSGARATSRS
jgi:hypothetical protein